MSIDRRTALGLLGLGVISSRLASAHEHLVLMQANPQRYRLQFFSARENALLDRLAEMILPADSRSGGAHEAGVSHYIDLVAAHSSEARKAQWKSGLAAFSEQSVRAYGKEFLELGGKRQVAMLSTVAANETKPSTAAEQFVVDLKRATVFAYYTSPVGLLKDLQYQGNKAVADFPGCSHGPSAHRG